MKKIILLFIVLFLLTGCTDYRELPDMAIISTVALDKTDTEYKIIVQVLDSKNSEESKANPSVIIYQNSGKTLNEAFKNISLEASKKLYTGHLKTFIVNENVFKEGASTFIDFVLRNSEIEKDFDILITKEDIEEIMNIIPPLESIPSEKISNSLEISSKFQGIINVISFDKFLSNIYITGIDPVLPSITIKNIESKNEEVNPSKRLILSKEMAIFKKDRFKGYISSDASLGLNILDNNTSSLITFKCDDKNYASIELINTLSSLKFDINEEKLYIDLKLDATLDELNCSIDTTKKDGINKLKNMFNKRIYEIIKTTINEEKYTNVDYLGIGKYIYQNNYAFYKENEKNIDNIIKNMSEDININTTFTGKTSIRKGDEKY